MTTRIGRPSPVAATRAVMLRRDAWEVQHVRQSRATFLEARRAYLEMPDLHAHATETERTAYDRALDTARERYLDASVMLAIAAERLIDLIDAGAIQ